MCGAGLEEDEMSSSGESEDFTTPEPTLETSAAEAEDDFEDPLGAYLEDFEDDEDEVAVSAEKDDSEGEGFSDDSFNSDGSDEDDEDARFDPFIEEKDEHIPVHDEGKFVAVSDPELEAVPVASSVPPRMKVDSGPTKKRVSFRNSRQHGEVEEVQEPQAVQSGLGGKPDFEQEESRSWRAQQRQDRRRDPMPNPSREAPLPERSVPVRAQAPQASFDNEGLLHGWLVNFSDPKGIGYELREGKFFVSHTPLKANDFVLNHPSVSTPHALMTLSDEYGLLVQDLMSETGVFVRREGDAIYRKEEEAVILGHGDWIRFGEEEFLVTLIPSLPRG